MVTVTGDIPDKIHRSVSFKGFVYMYGCSGEPSDPTAYYNDRARLMNSILRFDPQLVHWTVVEAVGEGPSPRNEATLLLLDGKLVIIGGQGPKNLARQRKKCEFWYQRNSYDLSCRCNYCWDMELTGEGEDIEDDDEDADPIEPIDGELEDTDVFFAREMASVSQSLDVLRIHQEGSRGEEPHQQQPSISRDTEVNGPGANSDTEINSATDNAPSDSSAANIPINTSVANDHIVGDAISEAFASRIRQMPSVKLTADEMESVKIKFWLWRIRNDPLASHRFFDIHVLDLSPSLKTLTLMSIADSSKTVDTSYLPPNLHLNLNTMYAFDPEGKKMPALSENEWEMLVHGKGDFRWNVVKTLEHIGAYDGSLFRLFMLEKFLQRV